MPLLSHNHCFAFKHSLFLVFHIDAHTCRHTHTHTYMPQFRNCIALTPLNSQPCLSRQQNKARKSECLPCGDKQSYFRGSAKLGHLLSRQSVRSEPLFLFLSHVRVRWVCTLSQDFRCHFHLNLRLSKVNECFSLL